MLDFTRTYVSCRPHKYRVHIYIYRAVCTDILMYLYRSEVHIYISHRYAQMYIILRICVCRHAYRVATTSRLLKIIGLFCRIQFFLQGFSAKKTYNFKEPASSRLLQIIGLQPPHMCISYIYIYISYIYIYISYIQHTVYAIHTHLTCVHIIQMQSFAFGMSFHLNFQFRFHWFLFDGTWRKRRTELAIDCDVRKKK